MTTLGNSGSKTFVTVPKYPTQLLVTLCVELLLQ